MKSISYTFQIEEAIDRKETDKLWRGVNIQGELITLNQFNNDIDIICENVFGIITFKRISHFIVT